MDIDDAKLSGYLGDHLLAAQSGVQLFDAAQRTYKGTEFEPVFAGLHQDIAADRDDLAALMQRLGYKPGPTKSVLAWAGSLLSKAGPLNPLHKDEGVAGQLELEGLQAAVHGKESLWSTLLVLSRYDSRLDQSDLQRLKDRAGAQQDLLAGIMDKTIPERFGA